MTLPYGPFTTGLSDDDRNRRLDMLGDAFPLASTRPLTIALRWLRTARVDWCDESHRGLERAMTRLPSSDFRHILRRYQIREAADTERQKARAGRAA